MSFDRLNFGTLSLMSTFVKATSSFDDAGELENSSYYVGTRYEETIRILCEPKSWRDIFPGCQNADIKVHDSRSFSLWQQSGRVVKIVGFEPTKDGVKFSVEVGRDESRCCQFSLQWFCRERKWSGSYLRMEVSNFNVLQRFNRSTWQNEVKLNIIDLLKKDEDNAPIVYCDDAEPTSKTTEDALSLKYSERDPRRD